MIKYIPTTFVLLIMVRYDVNDSDSYLALALHLTNRQAILLPRVDRVKNDSKHSFSRSLYCQSARSRRVIENFVELVSSAFNSYEHSGGKNANLDAMRPGHGGQQNKQQSSLKLKPFMIFSVYQSSFFICRI